MCCAAGDHRPPLRRWAFPSQRWPRFGASGVHQDQLHRAGATSAVPIRGGAAPSPMSHDGDRGERARISTWIAYGKMMSADYVGHRGAPSGDMASEEVLSLSTSSSCSSVG